MPAFISTSRRTLAPLSRTSRARRRTDPHAAHGEHSLPDLGSYDLFCSHRCKLIDLGKWLGGEHVISEPLRPEHLEPYADLSAGENLDQAEVE